MNKNINYGRDGLADYTCRRKYKMPIPIMPQKTIPLQPLVGKIKKEQISKLVESIHAYHGTKN